MLVFNYIIEKTKNNIAKSILNSLKFGHIYKKECHSRVIIHSELDNMGCGYRSLSYRGMVHILHEQIAYRGNDKPLK